MDIMEPGINITAAKVPLEIIEWEILTRVPAKSRIRFMCVCKKWHCLLSTDQQFARMHLQNSRARQQLLLFESALGTFRTLDCEEPNYLSTAIRSVPFPADPKRVLFLGSLDGLVCVAIRDQIWKLMFWNPLTGAYKKLPYWYHPTDEENLHAIGFYMDSSNDYKLLHVRICRRGDGEMEVHIYSMKRDKREVKAVKNFTHIFGHDWSHGTFSGKSLYFIANKGDGVIGKENVIIGFDVDSEKFREIQFPPVPNGKLHVNLLDVNDCIHLSVAKIQGHDRSTNLWRMKGEGWIKVASSFDNRLIFWNPTYVKRDGNWLLISKKAVYKHNLKTKDTMCLYTRRKLKYARYIETLIWPYN